MSMTGEDVAQHLQYLESFERQFYYIHRIRIMQKEIKGKNQSYLSFDYMGASEFELGGVGKACKLLNVFHQMNLLVSHTLSSFKDEEGKSLRILTHAHFPVEALEKILVKLQRKKLKVIEQAYFETQFPVPVHRPELLNLYKPSTPVKAWLTIRPRGEDVYDAVHNTYMPFYPVFMTTHKVMMKRFEQYVRTLDEKDRVVVFGR